MDDEQTVLALDRLTKAVVASSRAICRAVVFASEGDELERQSALCLIESELDAEVE